MGAIRQDSWREEDDQLLAEVTLQQIRKGGTQLSAFLEAAGRLGRTPAACGFRWNSVVRKLHETSIDAAKRERKKKKEKQVHAELITTNVVVDLEPQRNGNTAEASQMIQVVQQWIQQSQQIERENEMLTRKNAELKAQMEALQKQYTQMNDDYQAIVQIMERARRLTLFSDETPVPKIRFRMDENGNLEQYM
jgi:prespore-specific regulator